MFAFYCHVTADSSVIICSQWDTVQSDRHYSKIITRQEDQTFILSPWLADFTLSDKLLTNKIHGYKILQQDKYWNHI